MENEYLYSPEEIWKKFQHYREDGDFKISKREYKIFCDVISCLRKEDVDKVLNEVYFAVLSLDEGVQPACYLHLESKGIFENKKAIILLSPLVFDHLSGEDLHWYKDILHEVGHYILGHCGYKDQEDEKKKDKEADEWAMKWMFKCIGA